MAPQGPADELESLVTQNSMATRARCWSLHFAAMRIDGLASGVSPLDWGVTVITVRI